MKMINLALWAFAATITLQRGFAIIRITKLWFDSRTQHAHPTQVRQLEQLANLLQEFDETLQVGLVPEPERWEMLRSAHPLLGALIFTTLKEMRDQGASIQATLKRFLQLVRTQQEILKKARARVSLALGQALVCLCMVPVLSTFLYTLLPGVAENAGAWVTATFLALVISALGAFWIMNLALSTARLGFHPENEKWILHAPVCGERFLARVKCGVPPDLAWTELHRDLKAESATLSAALGSQLWSTQKEEIQKPIGQSEICIQQFGVGIKTAIQRSQMEGTPCLERVSAHIDQLLLEFQALQEKQLSLLPMQVLKPVFICLAPALFGLFILSMTFAWQEISNA